MNYDLNLDYLNLLTDFLKWRYAYLGGRNFIDRYIEKYSLRETDDDLNARKRMSYCPAFAKAGINEIRNSIYDRMSGIIRLSTSSSYMDAIGGNNGGVDHTGSSMNYFIGLKVLPELLVMGRVAVCIDMPAFDPNRVSHSDTDHLRPYLYTYTREQILDWKYDNYHQLTYLLLQKGDMSYVTYERTPVGTVTVMTSGCDKVVKETTTLNIHRIPVVIGSLSASLMEDVADYQIALLNICSSDVGFVWRANYPIYTEMYDNLDANKPNQEVKTGVTKGRRIPKGVEFPQFIAPSSECLKVSMEKQEQIKGEIRQLLSLSLSNLTTVRKSAENQQEQNSKEETGLSYIGLELESMEKEIAAIWAAYENDLKPRIHIKYPEKYSLKDRATVLAEAKELMATTQNINSPTFRKELSKIVVTSLFENKLDTSTLEKIFEEIDSSTVVNTDPDVLQRDAELGIASLPYISKLRGYPEGEAEKAREQLVEKMEAIAISQTKGGGIAAAIVDPPGANSKKDPKTDQKLPTRGKGR